MWTYGIYMYVEIFLYLVTQYQYIVSVVEEYLMVE